MQEIPEESTLYELLARETNGFTTIGHYQLERTLGGGAFARVHQATHILTGAKVMTPFS